MTGFPMLPYWEFDRWREMGRVQRIIDLRSPWQYEKERIRGSENIPYDEFWDHMDEINYGEMTVFYCERGAKSMVICRDLWRMGYEVADLAGGMMNYRGKYNQNCPCFFFFLCPQHGNYLRLLLRRKWCRKDIISPDIKNISRPVNHKS